MRDGALFRLTARRALDSVALVCAGGGETMYRFFKGKFFTGGRVGFPGFQPRMSAVALVNGDEFGPLVFYIVLDEVLAGFTGFV